MEGAAKAETDKLLCPRLRGSGCNANGGWNSCVQGKKCDAETSFVFPLVLVRSEVHFTQGVIYCVLLLVSMTGHDDQRAHTHVQSACSAFSQGAQHAKPSEEMTTSCRRYYLDHIAHTCGGCAGRAACMRTSLYRCGAPMLIAASRNPHRRVSGCARASPPWSLVRLKRTSSELTQSARHPVERGCAS